MRLSKPCLAASLAVALAAPGAAQEAGAPLDALVANERAFSRLSAKIGQAPAFLAYFGDAVVTFLPMPTKGKAALRERAAASPVPPAQRLDWEPWVADISATGDLGYTTGPVLVSDAASGAAIGHGWYFSMWQHDANGWRVTADIGITAPAVGALRPKTVAAGDALPGSPAQGKGEADLLALERQLSAQAAASGVAAAYEGRLAPSVRLYRNGMAPVQGAGEVQAYLRTQAQPVGWQPMEAFTSRGGDLAYSYGVFNAKPADAPGAAKAAFLHVWKRGSGAWMLVADIVAQ